MLWPEASSQDRDTRVSSATLQLSWPLRSLSEQRVDLSTSGEESVFDARTGLLLRIHPWTGRFTLALALTLAPSIHLGAVDEAAQFLGIDPVEDAPDQRIIPGPGKSLTDLEQF